MSNSTPQQLTVTADELRTAIEAARVLRNGDVEAHELTDDEGQDVNIGCVVIN